MMHFPIPFTRPPAAAELPAFVRVVSRSDVQWNRPIFKAPPLKETLPVILDPLGSVESARDLRFAR